MLINKETFRILKNKVSLFLQKNKQYLNDFFSISEENSNTYRISVPFCPECHMPMNYDIRPYVDRCKNCGYDFRIVPCPHCGTNITVTDIFCYHCGQELFK